LGESLEARYFQALGIDKPVPEDGYQGEYLIDFAQQIVRERGDAFTKLNEEERRRQFTMLALEKMLADQKRDLEDFGVVFDVWFRESALYESRAVEKAISLLGDRGHTYQAEGALWLRSTALGVEKDEVLVRGTGKPAYLAGDIAYHMDKFERGFERLIDIWGPDHHGHVARLRAGVRALGYDPDRLEILVHQIVRLVSEGEQVRMSKRAGDIVPLSDLVREVGKDAARFFFLMRSHDTPLDFDLELAKRQSLDNPVYYVQYGHARICSIFAEAQRKGVALPAAGDVDLSQLSGPDERALMRKIADFPDEVLAAAEKCEPHRLTRFGQEFAEAFHRFYTNCRVLGSAPEVQAARLLLVQASRAVLCNVLTLMGISAPERM
jgi:arginyl-tRNA synthetase